MPLYEYECTARHRHTEKIQKFSDPEITTCPHCGGELKRVITAPAFSLKGGGWYADGYGSAKPAAGGGEGESKGETGAKTEAGSSPAASESGSSAPAAAAAPASASASAPATSTASTDKK